MSDIEYSLPWTSEKLRLWSVQVITTWFHNPQDIYAVVIVMTSLSQKTGDIHQV